MKKRFNTTGVCIPSMHYMVNIDDKLDKIKKYIDRSDYFVINRPRQYGKTTTMYMLEQKLKQDYIVLSISFEGIGDDVFLKEEDFSKTFIELIADSIELTDENEAEKLINENNKVRNLRDVSKLITKFVKRKDKDVILFIDEVDKSSNNQLFLSFLGILRNKYLLRQQGKDNTFKSVILAGVYDIKNLKLKFRDDTERKYNSPWNIAVDFDVDMSFSGLEIETMLKEYSDETGVEMYNKEISEELYKYTSGYPFLVSRICQILDEKLLNEGYEWNTEGITIAVKRLIEEKNTLFDDLVKNIENNNELSDYIFGMLINGEIKNYNILNNVIGLGEMFGYFVNDNGKVRISNRIFEQVLYNYYSSKIESSISMDNYNFKDNFVTKTGLDFRKVLLRFQQFMKEQYSTLDSKFIEREGRLLFLAFIKPIINGTGFDFKEVQISEEKRIDIVITYLKEKYIVELKIWRGEEYHKKGLIQLQEYLDNQDVDKGFLLIYNFNKNKEYKSEKIVAGNKDIFTVWV
ncbi:AAA family ATPase [Clostridium butyricum]|jgi:hypothetical protein|uniref:AAA family ATPase n=1 Tax=Clostridium butyricum TaxID=1492 RepID=A0A6L9EKZ1_CLOBU|nr:AAA family ATPase [Clostridium butyricum]NAS17267.1 AAA family ATPase [Clostridium butyricum]